MAVITWTLVVSILLPQSGFASGAARKHAFTHEVLGIHGLDITEIPGVDIGLVETVFSKVNSDVRQGLKELVAVWASQGWYIRANAQLGIIHSGNKTEIVDLAEMDLTLIEESILTLLTALHFESKLVPFISSLIEILKKDPKYGPMVSSVGLEQKLLILTMLDQTIGSTAALRDFSRQTWTQLSGKLELKLNRFETNKKNQTRLSNPVFMQELFDVANAKFYQTKKMQVLVDGPASFNLRDQQMKSAKESINMLTWAVLDDKTGKELADLLILKSQQGVKVRLIVDGQVSHRIGYNKEVKRLEENGVEVVRWYNPEAKFMGQHRKILIIDGSFVITGGMNPGDTYSHKAGEARNFWRDTDVAFEGQIVEHVQRLFVTIWNRQILDQDLTVKKIVKVKKIEPLKRAEGQAMIIDHQPQAVGDQHEILLAIMKSIRGAEMTVDIENAYMIVFPSLLQEIKAAVDRGVRVRILTNSTESVDEKVIALPIVRSAQKLLAVGAEVYLKKGSTLHSKFMIVDSRLFLIGSYNLHPRSERMEGESIMLFDNKKLAAQATQAFENDISSENAIKMDMGVNVSIPINGETLLPLRMFYDQL